MQLKNDRATIKAFLENDDLGSEHKAKFESREKLQNQSPTFIGIPEGIAKNICDYFSLQDEDK